MSHVNEIIANVMRQITTVFNSMTVCPNASPRSIESILTVTIDLDSSDRYGFKRAEA